MSDITSDISISSSAEFHHVIIDAGDTLRVHGNNNLGLIIHGDVTLNGTLVIGKPGDPGGAVRFGGTNTHAISGFGEILFESAITGGNGNKLMFNSSWIGGPGSLSIGSGILVHGSYGQINDLLINDPTTLHNAGIIWADQAHPEGMRVSGIENTGVVRASAGGRMKVIANWTTNAGLFEAVAGGILDVNGGYVYSLTNSGTIRADGAPSSASATNMIGTAASLVSASAGGTVTLDGNWRTDGAISVDAGHLVLGGAFPGTSLARLTRTNGGAVRITGSVGNSGNTITLDASTGSFDLAGATIMGGTVRTLDADTLNVVYHWPLSKISRLDGVTLNGAATIGTDATLDTGAAGLTLDAATVTFTGANAILRGPFTGTGLLLFNSGIASVATTSSSAEPFVYGPGLTFATGLGSGTVNSFGLPILFQSAALSETPGQSLVIHGAITNTGIIRASNAGIIGFNPATLVNQGTLDVTGGVVRLVGSFSTGQYRGLALPVTPLQIAGSVDNSADTLSSTPAGPLALLPGAVVNGGTLTAADAAPITSSGNVTFGGAVTLSGPLVHSAGLLRTGSGGLVGNQGLISLASVTGAAATLLASANTTIAGSLHVTFDGATPNGNVRPDFGSLTLEPGVVVRTGSQSGTLGGDSNTLSLNGTASAETPARTLTIRAQTATNTGDMRATNGAGLLVTATTFHNAGAVRANLASVVRFSRMPASNIGTIDVVGGAVIVDHTGVSPAQAVRQQLRTGYADGAWTGTGISSSTAAFDPTHTLAVAYIEANLYFDRSGARIATVNGQSVDTTTLLILPASYGDANVDGFVDAADYALIDKGFATNANVWWFGDFNYDGTVTSADYLLIDMTYLLTHPASPALLSLRETQFGPAYVFQLLTSIPEPSAALSLLACALPLSKRRTRR